MSFLADVIQKFLDKHGFLTATTEPTKVLDHLDKRKRVDSSEIGASIDELTLRATTLERPPREIYIHGPPDAYEVAEGTANESEEISWTDPATGRIYKVDPRTGNSYLWNGTNCDRGQDEMRDHQGVRRTLNKRPRLDGQEVLSGNVTPVENMPEWIRDALQVSIRQ